MPLVTLASGAEDNRCKHRTPPLLRMLHASWARAPVGLPGPDAAVSQRQRRLQRLYLMTLNLRANAVPVTSRLLHALPYVVAVRNLAAAAALSVSVACCIKLAAVGLHVCVTFIQPAYAILSFRNPVSNAGWVQAVAGLMLVACVSLAHLAGVR